MLFATLKQKRGDLISRSVVVAIIEKEIQITCRDNADGGETSYINTDFGNIIYLTRKKAEAELKELSTK